MSIWQQCLDHLQDEIPMNQFNMWIRPLQARASANELQLLAPNEYVLEWINERLLTRIKEILQRISPDDPLQINLTVGTNEPQASPDNLITQNAITPSNTYRFQSHLNPSFTFDRFVEGKSNQLARAAATQVLENPGKAYNPMLIYGGVGLGKTHLMHAIGNQILMNNPQAQILYLHSERFVAEMIKALRHNKMDEFKQRYRSLNVLLIDDIQFFAGERTFPRRILPYLQRITRQPTTNYFNKRQISQRNQWVRRTPSISIWLGVNGRH